MRCGGGTDPPPQRLRDNRKPVRWHPMLTHLCRYLALFGGALLLFITILVVTSVTGRALIPAGLGPIPGDFELVEFATALAVFSFLPWCQLQRGHVSVDILQSVLGKKVDSWLAAFYNTVMTAVSAVILWRLWGGMEDLRTYAETTFILQIPVWWAYAACLPLAALSVFASLWTVLRDVRAALDASRDNGSRAEAGR
ncbi:TRAP transporter small permease [Nisaea sediminum]|uniref:TRAP transporter small permease n=1 Tax=Nisaea sediminum TaxID=2775867 RepID=UPI00186965D5|nr:TRAP transporter small permease [Nisaea sediminum]